MAKKHLHFFWSACVFWLCAPAAFAATNTQYYQTPATKKMAELLQRLYREQDFRVDPNKTAERAAYYRQGLRQVVDLRTELNARRALADELLRSGESAAAVTELENLRAWVKEKGLILAPFFIREMRQLLALAYLRLGEQENCLLQHNHDSCIFPLRAAGVHQLKRGSNRALAELNAVLQDDAGNFRARWLLNVAYMTLGEYPAKVPPRFLLPSERFASDYDLGRFPDVAPAVGLNLTGHAGGAVMDDFDGDGLFDIMVSGQNPLDQLRLFHNQGNGAFQFGAPNRAETPRLYRNNRDGTFTDVTKQMRLDRVILAMGANFGDLDNDGWLDCYFGTGTPDFAALLPNKMFRNAEGRVFQDVTTSGGFGHLQKGHAVAFGDLNNDGAEDIFEVIGGAYPGDTYQSALFANPGTGNHWLALDLQGVRSNRAALGARIRVTVNTPAGPRYIYRAVRSGGSFGDSPLRQHIGLGNALSVKEVEIRWPAGTVQRWQNPAMEQTYRVREDASSLVVMPLKTFALARQHKMAM